MKLFNRPFLKWSLAGFVIGMLTLVFLSQQALAQAPQPALPDEALAAAMQSTAPQMSSAHFDVSWNVVGTGGGDMSSPHFKISSTMGQPTIGHKSSPHYQTCTGFWCGAVDFVREIFLPLILKQ